jgi:hypothetical protein
MANGARRDAGLFRRLGKAARAAGCLEQAQRTERRNAKFHRAMMKPGRHEHNMDARLNEKDSLHVKFRSTRMTSLRAS